MKPAVLIAGEKFGRTRDAFLRHGAEAWSCDRLPSEEPGPHLQMDWRRAIVMQVDADMVLVRRHALHWCVENPVGVLPTRSTLRDASQTIQPYQYGHDASKLTCLWHTLPLLEPTHRIPGRMVEWPRGSGVMRERWANQTDSGQNRLGPSVDRAAIRGATYAGWAEAFASQWIGELE